MLLKGRSEPYELKMLRYLNTRMELSEKERTYYSNLEKGYEGEMKFDQLVETIQEERYIINDLLLEVNNSNFQLDTVMISQGGIHLFDIKNFQGDCYLESDKLYGVTTGREYKNPLDQLKRSTTLFRQLLQNLKQNFLVEASVIFINPDFTLFHAPLDPSIILPTQLNRLLKDVNKTPSKLNDGHKKLAQKILSLHQTKHPFSGIPEYHYDQLKKGVYCKACTSYLMSRVKKTLVCGICGTFEKTGQAILRNVKEFELLFPEQKLTTQVVYEWCKVDVSKSKENPRKCISSNL